MEMNSNHTMRSLVRELDWFVQVMNQQFQLYFNPAEVEELVDAPPPLLDEDESPYARMIRNYELGVAERLVVMLALIPHLKPGVLDIFFTRNPNFDRPFTEFGGYLGKDHNGFLPTGETANFLITRGDIRLRAGVMRLFAKDHIFAQENILHLERADLSEPLLSGRLQLSNEYLGRLLSENSYAPESNDLFAAQRVTTGMNWEDLVVSSNVREEINQIKIWIENERELMQRQNFRKHIKPGFRSLFYGPPGTGKTLTACLLGKSCGLDVYRVDLSMIVSKYIGETEKNLARIFDVAERRRWILFFDEADALFGKRTQTKSSNDRYANQEVGYLLQRIEDFPGVVILASNLKSNIDEAFSRRFQSTVYFPMPDAPQREQLWEQIFDPEKHLEPDCQLNGFASKYELSGGSIINILRSSTLRAMQRGSPKIAEKDIVYSLRKEFQKYGKTI